MSIGPENFSESGITTPAAHAEAITPADDVDLTNRTRSIYVGGTGDLTVKMAGDEGDSIVTFEAVPVGSLLPIRVREIRSTLTTATLIVALW